jgi:hypothetical protein
MATHLDGFLKRWALLATILAAPLAASVPCVTSLNDSGPGSLRSCISTVTSGGTIAIRRKTIRAATAPAVLRARCRDALIVAAVLGTELSPEA